MALTVNFSTSQTSGVPGSINFMDTSTGTDVAVVSRRIFILTSRNVYLVQSGTSTSYEVWSGFPGTTTKTLVVLDKDYALLITVQWVDGSGNVLYTKTASLTGYTLFNESFDYLLTQLLTGNPLLINDDDFFEQKSKLRTLIDSGDKAILNANDIFGAQQCYDLATELRTNASSTFNANS